MWWKNLLFVFLCIVAVSATTAFVAPRRDNMAVPMVHSTADHDGIQQVVTRIDREFAAHWAGEGVAPVLPADDLIVARRLALALAGTIPSLEDIRRIEAFDPKQRLSMWTDRLLADRRHADYFAERLARAYVGVDQGPFLIYRRRRFVSWLSDQLYENQPYDALVRTLITADGLWTDSPEVNFFTVNTDDEMQGRPDPIRMAGRTSRAFLAVRLDCMQCHDDNLGGQWLQSDFHRLAAYYADPAPSLVGIRDKPRDYVVTYLDHESPTTVEPSVPFDANIEAAGISRREQLAEWVTDIDNRAFARAIVNRVWAIALGRPLVTPIDDIPLEGPYPPGLEIIADDFVAHDYDLKRLWTVITRTSAFRRDSRSEFGVTSAQESSWAAFPITRLRPEQVAGSTIQSGQLATIDAESHILVRAARSIQVNHFIERYGDLGQDEFDATGGTIPQRLVMLNGELVKEVTGEDPITNASSRIAKLATNDEKAIEAAYLTTLTRRPTDDELDYFMERLNGSTEPRIAFFEDLHWSLLNSTEFSWNH